MYQCRTSIIFQAVSVLLQLRFQVLPYSILIVCFDHQVIVIQIFYDEGLFFVHGEQNLLDGRVACEKDAFDRPHPETSEGRMQLTCSGLGKFPRTEFPVFLRILFGEMTSWR